MTRSWGLTLLNVMRWTWARYLESSGRTEAALALYDRVFSSKWIRLPSSEVMPIFNIEYAQLYLKAGKSLDAYQCCAVAVDQLSQPIVPNTKPEDVVYLLYCCKYFLSRTATFADSEAFRLARTIQITYDNIAIERVSRTTKYLINATPQWGARFDDWFEHQVQMAAD